MTLSSTPFSVKDPLYELDYFRVLSLDDMDDLIQHATRHTYDAGTNLFLEGDPAVGLWIIERGRIKIYKLSVDGNEHILHLLGPHNTFNDIAALDGGTNPANATTLSRSVVWLLPKDALHMTMNACPAFSIAVIHILTQRIRGLVGQIEGLALLSVRQRLARFLLQQTENPALSGPGVTRAAIAAHLATTPETISRVLRSLEESGAIEFDRHHIVIVREDLLEICAYLE